MGGKTKGVIKLNILSLFDGMSCGMLALQKSGIQVESSLTAIT